MEFHCNQTKKSRKMKVSIRFRFDKWFNATNQKPENHQNSLFRTMRRITLNSIQSEICTYWLLWEYFCDFMKLICNWNISWYNENFFIFQKSFTFLLRQHWNVVLKGHYKFNYTLADHAEHILRTLFQATTTISVSNGSHDSPIECQ